MQINSRISGINCRARDGAGGTALGTVRMSAAASRLPDFPVDANGSMATVQTLAKRFAHSSSQLEVRLRQRQRQVTPIRRIFLRRSHGSWTSHSGSLKHTYKSKSRAL